MTKLNRQEGQPEEPQGTNLCGAASSGLGILIFIPTRRQVLEMSLFHCQLCKEGKKVSVTSPEIPGGEIKRFFQVALLRLGTQEVIPAPLEAGVEGSSFPSFY